MRILYDGLSYKLHRVGGINRYFNNLIGSLPQNITPVLTGYRSQKIHYPSHPHLRKLFYPFTGLRPKRVSSWLEKQYFQGVTSLSDFDLLHPTYYWLTTQRAMDSYNRPVVVTVHDMIHEIFAERMDQKGQYTRTKRAAVLAAEAIICVSENTKQDLLERYKLSDKNITVIHLASQIEASGSYGQEPVPDRPYYLYVGSRNPNYKNFETLLKAFAKVISIQPNLALAVVGGTFGETESQRIEELGLTDYIELYTNTSDRHLAKLYRCSLGFVFPSLYEGFGIPPLEAMSCGTPVIASNCSSIPEVVGDAGILFNPQSIDDLADIMLHLADNPAEREQLIDKGYQRAKLFSWDKTVKKTLQVYRSIL